LTRRCHCIPCDTLSPKAPTFGATHLLEHHEDIRVIQVLLGHKKIENTARYSQVATKLLHEVKGPLEYLELSPPA